MKTEVQFSSRRFFMTLTLCACSVILLQNNDLSTDNSFLLNLLCVGVGLLGCFLFLLPSLLLKQRRDTDLLSLVRQSNKPLQIAAAVFYGAYFLYVAQYFLIPYTDMFCKKYYAGAGPCVIALLLLACCVYAAFKGANVITRFGIFLFVLAMVTNLLLFGGGLSSLNFERGFSFSGSVSAFAQNADYFLTPCFIAVFYACLSGYTRNFRLRQPVAALLLTGIKFALILFFIAFAVGEYAQRQEYQTFVLSRVAHFGSFAGIESFYMALSTMSVFLILSLILCCMCRAAGQNGNLKWIVGFAALIFAVHMAAVFNDSIKELFSYPLTLNLLTFFAAVVFPSLALLKRRNRHA